MDRVEVTSACAVARGTDLRRHARALHRAHDAAVSGGAPTGVRDVVRRSWLRVRAQGLDPDPASVTDPAGVEEVERRRGGSRLAGVMPELRASLTSVAEDADHIMVVTDASGVVLWREGSARVGRLAEGLGFGPGADWSESAVGTNAIGTALVEQTPVQLFSAEHFVRAQHAWTCTACPLHDPRTGEVLGIVDLSGPAPTVHPTTLALVRTAVRLAESSLWACHEQRLDALRGVAGPLLARVAGPALVVDEHGWVAASSGTVVRERVPAPVGGALLPVHGVGDCAAEPVPGGWLLRPVGSAVGSAAAPPRLRMEREGSHWLAIVEGTSVWRYPLSRRHAQILVLLARARTAGLDAAALSTALHGDAEHLVSVRAEVSRMRRALGGLILARPYRLAAAVDEASLPDAV